MPATMKQRTDPLGAWSYRSIRRAPVKDLLLTALPGWFVQG